MRVRHAGPAILLLAVPVIGGCGTTPKDRLQGKWVGERADNFAAAQSERVDGWLKGTSFEFKGARVSVRVPAESAREGTFKIAKSTEHELLVSFLRPQGSEDLVVLQFEDGGRLRWVLGDGRSIVLRKAND